MRLTGLSIALSLTWAAGAACTIELDRRIACGDGYVDRLAGEECDPLEPASFQNACRGTDKPQGAGGCDPVTCEIVYDECARCGDGIIDSGEECDGDNLGGERCPIDQPGLRCTRECKLDYSACPKCGNGMRDDGEECDFNDGGGFVIPRQCAGTEDHPRLTSPIPHYPYTFGETTSCSAECRFDRRGCSYCGNGIRDGALLIDDSPERYSLPELCDGEQFDDAALTAQFGSFCFQMDGDLRPNVGCGSACLSFVERPDDPPCCVKRGDRCPMPSDQFKCCYAYDHPHEEPCETRFDNMGLARDVCK